MKKILFLMMAALVITGCSKKENIEYFPNDSPGKNSEFDISSYKTPDIKNSYITLCNEDTNFVFISGLKDNCVWYGKYNKKNKEIIYSHTDKEPISKIKVDMGYGNYKEIYPNFIRYERSISRNENSVNMLCMSADDFSNTLFENFYLRLDFREKGIFIKSYIPVYNTRDYDPIFLRDWYDNSILFAANNYVICFGQDGSILHEVHGSQISYGDDVYPISLTKLIKIDTRIGLSILLYDIETEINSVNCKTYKIYSGDHRIKDISVNISSNIVKIKFKTIDFQGNTLEHSNEIVIDI